ncbi:MAG: hypothetical protein V4481_01350 [Patescibacteria group bacterium]
MKHILITGFGPFGPYPQNCTEIFARRHDGNLLAGYRIHSMVFEANIPDHNRGAQVMAAAQEIDACAIVALGMASTKSGLCIETVTRNRILNEKYCPAALNNTLVDPSRPFNEELELDVRRWDPPTVRQKCFSLGLHVETSRDPGGFCCNHLMYQMAVREREIQASEGPKARRIPWVYVHVPCTEECLPQNMNGSRPKTVLTFEMLEKGLRLLIGNACP